MPSTSTITSVLRTVAAFFATLLASLGFADILDVHNDTLTSYLVTSKSNEQDVRPLPLQRGVGLDGSRRASGHVPWALAGNPFGQPGGGDTVMAGVNLATGAAPIHDVDLALPAPGFSWTVGRSYNSRQKDSGGSYFVSGGQQGANWFQSSQPEIMVYDDATNSKDTVYLIYGADRYLEFKRFDNTATQFKGVNGAAGVVDFFAASGAQPEYYVWTDQHGYQTFFFGFDSNATPAKGQFWKVVDPAGNMAYAGDASTKTTAISSGYDGSGKMTILYQTLDAGATRRFTYAYTSGKLTSVVVAEKPSGGSYTNTGYQVEYSYYVNADTGGEDNDLKTVTVTTPLTDSGVTIVKKKHYRYYEGGYDAVNNPGYDHQIKMIVDFEGCRKFSWDEDADMSTDDFPSAAEADLKPYSAAFYKYDTDRRIVSTFSQGACGCSGGSGDGTYTLEYETNSQYSNNSGYDTAWCTRTVVKAPRPDSTIATNAWTTVFFDEVGQPLHTVVSDADPDSASNFWCTVVTRDSAGRVTQVSTPANVTAYTHAIGVSWGFTTSSSVGLVMTYPRIASGETAGFVEYTKHLTGTSGSAYLDSLITYDTRTMTIGSTSVVRPVIIAKRAYTTEITSGSSGAIDTDFYPSWWSSSTGSVLFITLKEMGTQYEAVTTGNNGSNVITETGTLIRKDGTPAFAYDQNGVWTYTGYTNGQVTKQIVDAQTDHATDFGADDPGDVTNWSMSETSDGLRLITEMSYDGQGRSDVVIRNAQSSTDKRRMKSYYSKLKDGRLVTLAYNDFETSPGTKFYGPVRYSVTNQAGRSEVQATVSLTSNESTTGLTGHIDETDADPITAMDLGTVAQMSTSIYNESGTQLETTRAYFVIPGSGAGVDGTNYDATTYAYDDLGFNWRVKSADGTIRRTVRDIIGRSVSTYIGTNDYTFADGEVVNAPNMVKVSEVVYDGGGEGNGHVTTSTAFVEDSATDQRVTTFSHDVRGRVLLTTNPTAPHVFSKYDNVGRSIATGLFSSTGSITVASDDPTTETANRLALSQTFYDERGQVWKSQRHQIDDADGSNDDNLQTLNWYDNAMRLIKTDGEQLVKITYDRIGRQTHKFILANDDADASYAAMDDLTGDIVLEEHQTTYDVEDQNVIMQATISRFHDDSGGSETTGALDTNADTDALKYTAADVEGRIQITATWYDRFDRPIDTVSYGTNGGTTFDRDGLTAPTRSPTELRTTYTYNTDGTLQQVEDPKALKTRTLYDALGRTVATIANYVNGTPSGSPTATTCVDDNYTRYDYTDGHQTKMWVDYDGDGVVDSSPDDQETIYVYGVTKGVSAGDSKISSGRLLFTVQYPDSSGGSDVVTYAYNAQGQKLYEEDQAGTTREMVYDDSGRMLHTRLTAFGSGIDQDVKRITKVYDGLGRPSTVSQYNHATVGSGTLLDQVKYTYDDWGMVSLLEQDFDSAVSGGGNDREVAYTWSKATGGADGGRNTLRLTGQTLPDGTAIDYFYSPNNDLHDDEVSRVTSVQMASTDRAIYRYLGVGHVVDTDLPEPDAFSRRYGSTGTYPDFDAFNRPVSWEWTKDLSTDRDYVDVDLTYDENSNITLINDAVLANASDVGKFDALVTMDALNRMTKVEEGSWNGSSISSRARQQIWDDVTDGGLDQTGNWRRHKTDWNGDNDFTDSGEYDDDRTHSSANEITARDTDNNGSDNYTLTSDAAGNLTDDGKDYKFIFDGFNRLKKITERGGSPRTITEFRYNGLGWRIGHRDDADTSGALGAADCWFFHVYDLKWREVNLYRQSTLGTMDAANLPKERYVYHNAGLGGSGGSSYIDLVILRDRDDNSTWNSAGDGTLERRDYYCQNWHADVAALISDTGKMVEWGQYPGAYGLEFGLPGTDVDADGDVDASDGTQYTAWIGVSAYRVRADWDLDNDVDAFDSAERSSRNGLTQGLGALSYVKSTRSVAGYVNDRVVPVKHIRHRVLHNELGRWVQRDPMGYVDGVSLYGYGDKRPLSSFDSMGLACMGLSGCSGGSSSATAQSQPSTSQPAPPPHTQPTGTGPEQCSDAAIQQALSELQWLIDKIKAECPAFTLPPIRCCETGKDQQFPNGKCKCRPDQYGLTCAKQDPSQPNHYPDSIDVYGICICTQSGGKTYQSIKDVLLHELKHLWQICRFNKTKIPILVPGGPYVPGQPQSTPITQFVLCAELGVWCSENPSNCNCVVPADDEGGLGAHDCCAMFCDSGRMPGVPISSFAAGGGGGQFSSFLKPPHPELGDCLADCMSLWNSCHKLYPTYP